MFRAFTYVMACSSGQDELVFKTRFGRAVEGPSKKRKPQQHSRGNSLCIPCMYMYLQTYMLFFTYLSTHTNIQPQKNKGLLASTWHLGPLLRVNPLGTYNRSMRESQRIKGQRSKLSPKEVLRSCERGPRAHTR